MYIEIDMRGEGNAWTCVNALYISVTELKVLPQSSKDLKLSGALDEQRAAGTPSPPLCSLFPSHEVSLDGTGNAGAEEPQYERPLLPGSFSPLGRVIYTTASHIPSKETTLTSKHPHPDGGNTAAPPGRSWHTCAGQCLRTGGWQTTLLGTHGIGGRYLGDQLRPLPMTPSVLWDNQSKSVVS